MIRLINKLTGTDMWVADSRLNEYLDQGHKLPPAPKPEKPTQTEPAKKTAKKKTG